MKLSETTWLLNEDMQLGGLNKLLIIGVKLLREHFSSRR